MPQSQMQRIREGIKSRPRTTFVVSLAVLICGAYLIWNNQFTSAPDPGKGDLAAATRFLSGDRFMSLSSAQRNEYLNSLGARYLQESAANRQMIENALKANGIEHSTQRSIAIGMLRQMLTEYRKLTPAQRQARVGVLRTFATAMGFKGPLVSGLNPAANPVANATGSEENFQKSVSIFTRDLLNELNAEERATLSMVTKDIHQTK